MTYLTSIRVNTLARILPVAFAVGAIALLMPAQVGAAVSHAAPFIHEVDIAVSRKRWEAEEGASLPLKERRFRRLPPRTFD